MLKDFFTRLGQVQSGRKLYFFGTPAGADTQEFFENLFTECGVENFHYFNQPESPFFERLQFLFKTIGENESEDCFIHLTGTDIPDFPFENMANPSNLISIAPDNDGGFYYLGAQAKKDAIFDIDHLVKDGDVSVYDVLSKRADELGEKIEVLPVWSDIDTLEDLRNFLKRSNSKELVETHKCAKENNII